MTEPTRADWWPRFLELLLLTGRRVPAAERAGVRESTVRKRYKSHDAAAAEYHETLAAFHAAEAARLRAKIEALRRVIGSAA